MFRTIEILYMRTRSKPKRDENGPVNERKKTTTANMVIASVE